MTVMRLTAAATLNSKPRPTLRNGTRNTPPPRPSSDPRQPPTAPAAMTAITTERVMRWAADAGARELAAVGARVIAGPGSGLAFEHEEPVDEEQLSVGDLTLTLLHTPGHTPEHVSVLVEHPGEPRRLFTGDLLFVGAVGRPDLLGEAQARRLAEQLFTSLQRVMELDDEIEVHPGHGAGSLCGAEIGKEPSSTIGRERAQNPMVRLTDRKAFVEGVLGDLPETQPSIARTTHV